MPKGDRNRTPREINNTSSWNSKSRERLRQANSCTDYCSKFRIQNIKTTLQVSNHEENEGEKNKNTTKMHPKYERLSQEKSIVQWWILEPHKTSFIILKEFETLKVTKEFLI